MLRDGRVGFGNREPTFSDRQEWELRSSSVPLRAESRVHKGGAKTQRERTGTHTRLGFCFLVGVGIFCLL